MVSIILVTASAMPMALEIKPMSNADGIGQTALKMNFFVNFEHKITKKCPKIHIL